MSQLSEEHKNQVSLAFSGEPQKNNYRRYHVVTEDRVEQLVSEVNDFLQDGWECQGGICSEPLGDHHQAMTKLEVMQ